MSDESEPKTARQRIYAERERQIKDEGCTLEHDDEYSGGELAMAGFCYLRCALVQRDQISLDIPTSFANAYEIETHPRNWPWDLGWFKLGATPERTLEKAGALFLAELDRLSRQHGGTITINTVPLSEARKGLSDAIVRLQNIIGEFNPTETGI